MNFILQMCSGNITRIIKKPILPKLILLIFIFYLALPVCTATDYTITGRVTDNSGATIPDAKVTILAGNTRYEAISGYDGSYRLKIVGIYSAISGSLEPGMAYPNPFIYSANIPFIINTKGDITFSVYNYTGKKLTEKTFNAVEAGSYRIIWDGCSTNGTALPRGVYIYAITFKGKSWSGKLIKSESHSSFSGGTTLEPVMMPPSSLPASVTPAIPVITSVTCNNYYTVRLTDIIIRRDTIIDFEITALHAVPFRTNDEHIEMHYNGVYKPLFLKGINLGSSPPGTFPGEIAYAIPDEMYEQWIKRIGEAGFNSIRVYTLHPPVFYEKLANYNNRHTDNPLLLFQGIWLEEVEDASDTKEYDLMLRIPAFTNEIRENIDCLHGNKIIGFRPGKAYGEYATDISRWIAGYIIGREISPQEVEMTNDLYPSDTAWSGSQFEITGASATEVFVTKMLDETVRYEADKYNEWRPVSISSWPTLDPLIHPTETYGDEDIATFEINKISGRDQFAGIFATYHAYPYYPNFISTQPSYQAFSDSYGPNSYLGYITDLKNYYSGIPLVIGEFGVPSSWGSAHQSYSEMNHGGYSEQQQGEKNIRLLHNIADAGCAGGFMFSWMDEWFKTTWVVQYLEAFGIFSDNALIPTRQLWHNVVSPEQNFGLLTFGEQESEPFATYQTNLPEGPVKNIEATNDNSFFYVNIEVKENLIIGDTLMVAFDTYSGDIGESQLPNGKVLDNRSEFLLTIPVGMDTALYHVTEAYDMNGLTSRFNLSDPAVQKYESTVTDGAPWKLMEWINDQFELTVDLIGLLPMENSSGFTFGQRSSVSWSYNKVRIRIPWTLLYFYDPTQMMVIKGAYSEDGGRTYNIIQEESDGIAVSVYHKGVVTSSVTRYNWNKYLVAPKTIVREKKSLQIVETGLLSIPGFL